MLKKPLKGGSPPNARAPTVKQNAVAGILPARPPISRMSSLSMAWLTLPALRKSIAFAKAWASMWKMAAVNPLPQGQHHEAQVAHRGIGEDALQVCHHQGHGACHEGRDDADDCHQRHGG